ncbi:MAG: sodium-dependent transporter [Clostridiales bacterium]|nr:sodium-dependent transporter [Clostridiales bacterium]
MMEKKTKFSSRLGFVLAAAGSAVGLGNIWRFPYLAAKYGGGIFLLVYLILAVTFGFSLMVTEIAIGRKTGKSAIKAYKMINKKFSFLGYLAALVPIIIFPYYCVIGGWVVKFLGVYLSGQGHIATGADYFSGFIGSTAEPLLCLAIFLVITSLVVIMGVQKGIEKVSKILMPLLILMSLGTALYSLTIDGAIDGLIYYIKPNFSEFSIKTVVAAMGQLFYSMSLAMGIMVTYGSYMRKDDDLEKSVRNIEIFDTGIAFLSGLMIVPAVFAFSGGNKDALQAGPTLMFITLPNVFDSMKGGHIFGLVFFLLVLFAALTSAISLMETIVSIVSDKFGFSRVKICIGVMIAAFMIAVPSSLGFGVLSGITIFGYSILDFFDFISNNILMPIVAMITAALIGFAAKPDYISEEVKASGKFKSEKLYRVMIKYVVPVCMVVILISSLVGYV